MQALLHCWQLSAQSLGLIQDFSFLEVVSVHLLLLLSRGSFFYYCWLARIDYLCFGYLSVV